MQYTVFIDEYLENIDNLLTSIEFFENMLKKLAEIYKTPDEKLKLKINILLNMIFLKIIDSVEFLNIFSKYKAIFFESLIYYQVTFLELLREENNLENSIYDQLYKYVINENLNIAYLNQDITYFSIECPTYIDIKKVSLKLAVMSLLENLTIKFDNEYERKLAHYTSLDVSNKIINQNAQLRLNSIEYVNDPSEGKIFYDFLKIDKPTKINTVDDKNDPYYRYDF
ncbi:hypothetical protein, partial [Acinetobacter ursingii]